MIPEDKHNDGTTLAGEYVLGTLEGQARIKFEHQLRNDKHLQDEVDAWHRRFAPMLDEIDPVSPPDRVWAELQQRLVTDTTPDSSPSIYFHFWDSLRFWRNFGLSATVITLALSIGLTLMTGQQDLGMNSVMVVTNDQHRTGWLVSTRSNHKTIHVNAVEPSVLPAGKVCQLWMESEQGQLYPIGLMPHKGRREMPLPMMPDANNMFKVSVEDIDKVPAQQPSHNIVFTGKLTDI
jgi:anti-sigma-K factor RskA